MGTCRGSIPLGTDLATGDAINLSLARLSEHVDVLGPTGSGKTQGIMLPLFQKLSLMPDITVIAATCKGDFCTMCADSAVENGLTESLVVFNPANTPVVGFNPARRNGWPAERHAKITRTALLAARGAHSLDETPQLARLLFLCLAVALEQGLSLIEAARLLRPGRSALRTRMLSVVQSEFLRESLEWFDTLKDPRQEELAASTVGRLENFVGDPLIRAILTEDAHCLDIGDVIRNNKKLCIDVGLNNPLVPDDAKTMLRLLLNSILAHQFALPKEKRTPTVLLLDEIGHYATEDLATALTLGREMQIFAVIAHQFPSQMKLPAEDSHLFESVQHCCRTKIVFGGMHVTELEPIVKDLMIGEFNPLCIKDEQRSPYFEPLESARETWTVGGAIGRSHGVSVGTSFAVAQGRSRSVSRQWGASHSHSDALSTAHSSATNAGASTGETLLPTGETIIVEHNGAGTTEADASGMTTTDTYGEFQSQGEQDAVSLTRIEGKQQSLSASVSETTNVGVSRAPFYEYLKRWTISSRTFQTLDEFLTIALQAIKAQPRGHFVIKVPDHKAIFVRAKFVRVPWVPKAMRERAWGRIYGSLLSVASHGPEPAHNRVVPLSITADSSSAYQSEPLALEFREPPPTEFVEKRSSKS